MSGWARFWTMASLLHVGLSIAFTVSGAPNLAAVSLGWAILTHLWAKDNT